MRSFLIAMLLLAGCEEAEQIPYIPIAADPPRKEISFISNSAALPLQMDKTGRLLFECRKCPNKFCKQFACNFETTTSGRMIADCECAPNPPTKATKEGCEG